MRWWLTVPRPSRHIPHQIPRSSPASLFGSHNGCRRKSDLTWAASHEVEKRKEQIHVGSFLGRVADTFASTRLGINNAQTAQHSMSAYRSIISKKLHTIQVDSLTINNSVEMSHSLVKEKLQYVNLKISVKYNTKREQ